MRVSPTCLFRATGTHETTDNIREYEAPDKIVVFLEDRAESEKKIKNGAPRVPDYFCKGKAMILKRVTKMMFPKRKNMTKRSGRS